MIDIDHLIYFCTTAPCCSGGKLPLISEKAETADSTRLEYDVSKPSQKTESPLIHTATEMFDNLAKLIRAATSSLKYYSL